MLFIVPIIKEYIQRSHMGKVFVGAVSAVNKLKLGPSSLASAPYT